MPAYSAFPCFTAVGADLAGWDLLPEPLGYGILTLGAAILASSARGRSRFIPVAGFALAGLLDALARSGVATEATGLLAGVLAVSALTSLPLLRRGLEWAQEGKPPAVRLGSLVTVLLVLPVLVTGLHLCAGFPGLRSFLGRRFLDNVTALIALSAAIWLLIIIAGLWSQASSLAKARESRIRAEEAPETG